MSNFVTGAGLWLASLQQGPQKRDAQRYLNSSTTDWTQTSLINLFAATRPGLAQALSAEESHLLWRIFHFHAYHPFPPPVADSPIDYTAYERAVGLHAAQGTSILGVQNEKTQGWPADGEIRWYERRDTFEDADLRRVVRSVGVEGFSLDDVMDVLVAKWAC
ncbi:hypothetical protein BDW42DRAFT_191987 [Aspergillus taichungensis]|uniref:Uncharacterized protein n=1 Tax=Aspergillus taichungensis TaxID=482145 RepID=A0A2J5I1U2_9EURO|nr:hypothetical protein BDW42DRAFT_191987 [Aspergillus taichungensis]